MHATEDSNLSPLATPEVAPEPGERANDPPVSRDRRIKALVEAHYDFIWRSLRRRGLPPEAADDAAQQVFMVASRRLDDLVQGAERSFLYRTAVRVGSDARRGHLRQAARSSPEDVTQAIDPTPNPEELTDRKRARALLDKLLETLDEDLREVFVLFELDGMGVPEIASLLGIPQGTCASRLRRAREAFKDGIKRLHARQASPGRSR
jgi:RNA polymerase sigma-70 factor (ECF subfamily)